MDETTYSDNPAIDRTGADVTAEVGSEGGSPGDVEVDVDAGPATGSEAGETWQPTTEKVKEVHRDETGKGRRTP
jgi:hypothetical protein